MESGFQQRRLLSLDEAYQATADFLPGSEAGMLFVAISTICASMVIVIALALCVCGKKEGDKNLELKTVTPRVDRRSSRDNDIVDSANLQIEVEGAKRQSNGSATHEHIRENVSSNSNDKHRAESTKSATIARRLPEIPGVHTPLSGSDDAVFEGREENYYSIPKDYPQNIGKQAAERSSAIPAGVDDDKDDSIIDPYNTVKDDTSETAGDSASGAVGGVDPKYTRVKGEPPYAKVKGEPPYSKVKGEPPYSKIKTDTSKNDTGEEDPDYATTEDDYAAITPPPVPNRGYLDSSPLQQPPRSTSPNLPSRNLNPHIPAANLPLSSSAPQGTSSVTDQEREPPYNQVTVRESLQSIRERQQEQLREANSRTLSNVDEDYASVDADKVKSEDSIPFVTPPLSDLNRTSQYSASEVYAEISPNSGENSNRSSLYAGIQDSAVSSSANEKPASRSKDDTDIDPRYDVISRPKSSVASSSFPSPQLDPSGSPLYSEIDKSKKSRKTIHIDDHARLSQGASSNMPLYSVVNKPRKSRLAPGYDNHIPQARASPPDSMSKTEHNNGGVDMTSVAKRHPGLEGIDVPGYQTVSDVERVRMRGTGDHVDSETGDPGYDCVRPLSDMSQSSTGSSNRLSQNEMVHIDSHHVPDTFWQKSEHLYQEIPADSSRKPSKHKHKEKKKGSWRSSRRKDKGASH
ncbi:unnamed protein product [Owenia fusiformis]|nr:unnamed protein product [Owenia fusiformis]